MLTREPDISKCKFSKRVQTEWLDDGRDMKVIRPFTFTDSKGVDYLIPEGAITNGASIPRWLWAAVGSPFTGKYRDAAVVHDYLCEKKEIPFSEAHRIFYEAALTKGEDTDKARLMYDTLMCVCRW